jgi:hypothetical protein
MERQSNGGELRHPARVVGVQVRHHDGSDLARVDAPAAQLCRHGPFRLHAKGVRKRRDAAERLALVLRGACVKAGVHEDRTGAGVLDQKRGNRDPDPLRARGEEPHPAGPPQRARRPVEVVGADHRVGNVERVDANGRVAPAPRQRRVSGRGSAFTGTPSG